MSARPSKKPKAAVGRALLKKQDHKFSVSNRHTTDFGSANTAISITETTSIDEFLTNAQASQRNFEAERGQSHIIQPENELSDVDEPDNEDQDEDQYDDDDEDDLPFCSIPKKPNWRESDGPEEFQREETLTFLKWRKRLNRMQQKNPNLPPFEKNLEFWRQLWKIIEISDVTIQVVDARDPLFYHCQDLTDYVAEVAEWKKTVLLLNKADYLSKEQREQWAAYFRESDLKTLFFSAKEDDEDTGTLDEKDMLFNTSRIMTPQDVLQTLQTMSSASPLTVGFLGYPNVGKSSTINRFLTNKRLQVSATPGKTKHYQTHQLKGEVILVDGPGLVIPNLGMTKADMIVHGILPIDHLTAYFPPIDLILENIPFAYIQNHYGIMSNCIHAAKKADRKNVSNQILCAFGQMRGYMKPGGVPDQSKAARVILKDYVQGKLLFCHAPPGVKQEDFCNLFVEDTNPEIDLELDESFPELRLQSGIHIRGVNGARDPTGKKQGGKKKKDKARRMFPDPYNI